MPRHWWIAVGSSDATKRKKEVRQKVEAKKGKDALRSFWKSKDGTLYALVRADTLEEELKQEIRTIEAMEMEDVRG